MKVIGIKCKKDEIQWIVTEGTSRANATVIDHKEVKAPKGERPEQLAWARREILEIIAKYQPDRAACRVAQSGPTVQAGLGRAEMDGVVQAALHESGTHVRRFVSSSILGSFSAKNNAELKSILNSIDAVVSVAQIRQDQLTVALAELPM